MAKGPSFSARRNGSWIASRVTFASPPSEFFVDTTAVRIYTPYTKGGQPMRPPGANCYCAVVPAQCRIEYREFRTRTTFFRGPDLPSVAEPEFRKYTHR